MVLSALSAFSADQGTAQGGSAQGCIGLQRGLCLFHGRRICQHFPKDVCQVLFRIPGPPGHGVGFKEPGVDGLHPGNGMDELI